MGNAKEPLLAEKKKEHISFTKMVLFINVAMFLYKSLDTMTKDAFVNRHASLIDYGVIRSSVMLPFACFQLWYLGKTPCEQI